MRYRLVSSTCASLLLAGLIGSEAQAWRPRIAQPRAPRVARMPLLRGLAIRANRVPARQIQSRHLPGGAPALVCTASRSLDVALQRLNGLLTEPKIVLKARARFRHREGTSNRSDAQIDRTVTLERPYHVQSGITVIRQPIQSPGQSLVSSTVCVTVSSPRVVVEDKPAPKIAGKIWDFDM